MIKVTRDSIYMVLPSYVASYCRSVEGVKRAFDFPIGYWPGFAGGGIVSHPSSVSNEEGYRLQRALLADAGGTPFVYGTACGNEAAMRLREHTYIAHVYRAPAICRAEKLPNPSVKTTIEHIELCHPPLVLAVPRRDRKSVRLMEQLPHWFGHFGVILSERTPVAPELRQEMACWFDDPAREMFAFCASGPDEEAAWYLAMLAYVAEHWDVNAKGLDTIHLLANIETKPNFRKYWTSNR